MSKKPREAVGGAYERRGAVLIRVTVGPQKRQSARLRWITAEQWARHVPDGDVPCACMACERAGLVQTIVALYRAAGAEAKTIHTVVKDVACAEARDLSRHQLAADIFADGVVPKAASKTSTAKDTFRAIGERWTSGELHRLHPDHVRAKRSAGDDAYRLEILCATGIGDLHVTRVDIEECEKAMRDLDATRIRIEGQKAKEAKRDPRPVRPLEVGGRRQYAQILSMILGLSAYPLRLIKTSPLPRGWLPKVPVKAKSIPYPDEEAAVLADTNHDIRWRFFFGALTRFGHRADETASLDIANVDVVRGIVTLDENKTDDPRAPTYAEVPGLVRALKWYKETFRANAKPSDPFFIQPSGARVRVDGLAERWQGMLEASTLKAGLHRPEMFTRSTKARLKTRAHDLRGLFVSSSLAHGRTESWVMDRTGHRSSMMVNRYRRVARTMAEAQLGDLARLDRAVPEIAAAFAAADAAADAKEVDERPQATYRNHASNGPIAQSVELRTFNP